MKILAIVIIAVAIAIPTIAINQPKQEVSQDAKPGVVATFHNAQLQHTIDGTTLQGGIVSK